MTPRPQMKHSHLKQLFDLSLDLLCVGGMDGVLKELNPAFRRVLGYSDEELKSRPFAELVLPADRTATEATLAAVKRGERVFRFENRLQRKDGSHRWVSWSLAPSPANGLFFAVGRDTTEIRHSMETLLRNLPGMAYRCLRDEHWTMRFVSHGSHKLTGYAPEDLIGNKTISYAELIHPEDRARIAEEVDAALAEDGEFMLEYRIRTLEGEEKRVWERGHAIRMENGSVFSLEGFITDITDRRKLETELSQLQKMDSLGQLTGGIAHDFNNLLAVVIGNLELLEDRIERRPETSEFLGDAMESAWRGAELSQRLLAFSRRQMLNPEIISVNALLKGMETLLRRTLGGAINVEVLPPEDLPLVRVDAGQLENAILNLALNARDAMPDGGDLLIRAARFKADADYAATRPDVTPGPYVMIEVSDTGTGMPPEVVERVFEPFFTTKDTGKGTGLGLSMVYGFLQQSGGHARIYSEVGHGTSVKLYLPEAPESEKTQTVETIRLLQQSRGQAERILVVEDDPFVRKMVVANLHEFGYRTIEADSGPSALQFLEADPAPVDLLLTDVVMPGGMSGLELAREVRKRQPKMKVLLTSGFSEQQAARDSEFELLSKPYRKVQLAQAVRRALLR